MTALSTWYIAAYYGRGGLTHGFGSLMEPVDESQVAGERYSRDRFTVAAGAEIDVYARDRDGSYARLLVRLVGEGYGQIAALVEDAANPGTLMHWQHLPNLSCRLPLILNSDEIWTVAAADDMNADDGNGSPALWADGTKVDGQVAKLRFRNHGAEAVTLERVLHA